MPKIYNLVTDDKYGTNSAVFTGEVNLYRAVQDWLGYQSDFLEDNKLPDNDDIKGLDAALVIYQQGDYNSYIWIYQHDVSFPAPETVRSSTRSNYFQTIWDALHMVREDCIPEGDESYDQQWNEITSAMAFLHEDTAGKELPTNVIELNITGLTRADLNNFGNCKTDSEGNPCVFHNKYECECGECWDDRHSCGCDDRCPSCNISCSATSSDWCVGGTDALYDLWEALPDEGQLTEINWIKAAVDTGKAVYWSNLGYVVSSDELGQYHITFKQNGSAIGLTDKSGRTLNGKYQEFFVADIQNLPKTVSYVLEPDEDGFKWLVISSLRDVSVEELKLFHATNTIYELFDDDGEGLRDHWDDFIAVVHSNGTLAIEAASAA